MREILRTNGQGRCGIVIRNAIKFESIAPTVFHDEFVPEWGV